MGSGRTSTRYLESGSFDPPCGEPKLKQKFEFGFTVLREAEALIIIVIRHRFSKGLRVEEDRG